MVPVVGPDLHASRSHARPWLTACIAADRSSQCPWLVRRRALGPVRTDGPSVGSEMPGKKPIAARQIHGDRFTAIGQFDVDLEYYIANPRDTQRWTMRWGHPYVDYSVQGEDYRDLLQLRLDGAGDYHVVMFPRFRDQAAPQFTTLGGGTVIKLQGDAGTDYCFLPSRETTVTAEQAEFRGIAGSVQDRPNGLVLAMGASGQIRYGDWAMEASQAASLRVMPNRLIINVARTGRKRPCKSNGGRILAAGESAPGVTLTTTEQGFQLEVPAGREQIVLITSP
jgi:hypothetical protein